VLERVGHCLGAGTGFATEAHRVEMEGILAALERGMIQGDRETRNVIAISFVRGSEGELFFGELFPLLGPKTRSQVST